MRCVAMLVGVILMECSARPCSAALDPDAVVERIHAHGGSAGRPIVVVVGPENLPKSVWLRVKNLIAYRIHRPSGSGANVTDAAIYLVRTSELYRKAEIALRADTTEQDDVWCRLAGVLSHEAAHTRIDTEREALEAEAAHLRRCLNESHLSTTSVVRLADYIARVEAKLRRFGPR